MIDITPLRNSTVQYLYGRREEIDMEPLYQRQGAIWSQEKQQLLIDSLINEFDVPKIYFHQFPVARKEKGTTKRWALIDGKQRLEAVFGFLDGAFPLSDDFVHLATDSGDAAGKTYRELSDEHPTLVSTLNATMLDVVTIRTDDLELIEEMFSRLNEAVPLNAAEKRNAIGGPLPPAVRELVTAGFFTDKLPFTNRRYRHFDLAAKFLYWSDNRVSPRVKELATTSSHSFVRDTKKVRLDAFFREVKQDPKGGDRTSRAKDAANSSLDLLEETFVDNDSLLTSIGMVSLYYLLAELYAAEGTKYPPRSTLVEFDAARRVRRMRSDEELAPGEYELLEFGRLSQSPNDGSALTYRLTLLHTWLSAKTAGEDPMRAVAAVFNDQDD